MSYGDTGDKTHQWGEPVETTSILESFVCHMETPTVICMSHGDTGDKTHQWDEPVETTFTLQSFVCHMETQEIRPTSGVNQWKQPSHYSHLYVIWRHLS